MITVCNKSNHLRQNKMLQNSFHLHPICYTFTGPLCLVAREVLQIHGQAIRKGRTAHFSSKPGHVGLHCETALEETCYHLLFLFILPSDSFFFFFLNVGNAPPIVKIWKNVSELFLKNKTHRIPPPSRQSWVTNGSASQQYRSAFQLFIQLHQFGYKHTFAKCFGFQFSAALKILDKFIFKPSLQLLQLKLFFTLAFPKKYCRVATIKQTKLNRTWKNKEN